MHLNLRTTRDTRVGAVHIIRYAEAIDSCVRSTAHAPEWTDYMLLTAAYAMRGDANNAALARDELMKRRPGFYIGWLVNESGPMDERTRHQRDTHLIAGLRKAGVAESPPPRAASVRP